MPASPGSAPRRVRFGVFDLDLRCGELRKAGTRVRLAGQPLKILIRLLERPGDLVTRDELRQELWTADTFVDFERNLNSSIKRLRAALGDSADAPRFIETLPKRGYRFLVPTELVGEPAPLADPPVATIQITIHVFDAPRAGADRHRIGSVLSLVNDVVRELGGRAALAAADGPPTDDGTTE